MSSSVSSVPNTHIFFCNEADCNNMTTYYDSMCDECCEGKVECPDCGVQQHMSLFGTNGYCAFCWSQRFGPLNHCNEWAEACAEQADLPIRLPPEPVECKMCGDMAAPGDSQAYGWVCDECFQALDHHANCKETRDMCCCLRAMQHVAECEPKPEGYECEVCKEMTAPHYGMAGWMCDMCFKHTLAHKGRCDETRENCCCSGVLLYVAEHGPSMIMCDTCETEQPANGPGVTTCAACTPRQCECDGSGRMCDLCSEEYHENCRGCGDYGELWDETYCRDCHRERYGVPETKPVHKSLESMRAEIAEIEFRLLGNMTKGQKDDWRWILQNRRADLAEAEKEMWAGYDQDDLNKLDRRC